MAKFSGTKRRPAPRQPDRADPHACASASAPTRAARALRARRRVGAVPARGHEHGRRGHVLRARRGPRRPLRRARPRGDRRRTRRSSPVADVEAGKVGLVAVPARDDAHAFGRCRDGGGVRGRRRRRWPVGGRPRPAASRRAGRDARLLARPRTAATCPMPVKRGVADAARRLYTERAVLRYDGLTRQIRMADVRRAHAPVAPRRARSRRCSSSCSTVATTTTPWPTRPLLPVLAAAAALDAVPVDERRAAAARPGPGGAGRGRLSRGSGCRAGCRAAWTRRRGRRSSRRWA